MNQLLQGHPGLLVSQLDQVQQHFGSLRSSLCVGPAAVLIVGVEESDLPLDVNGTSMIVPGWVGAHAAALQCTLLQVGDEPVECWSVGALSLPSAGHTCQVVQFHVFKDECTKWKELVSESFEVFLKKIGFVCPMKITQTWAFGYYTRGKKADPDKADYHHGFLKLEEKAAVPLLKLGGYEGFYPNPSSTERGPDPNYRAIPLRGCTLAEALPYRSQSGTYGLTRSRQGYGLRVLAGEYAVVKKRLFPSAGESSDSEQGGVHRFQLLGVPVSTDRSKLKTALKAFGWPTKVSRAAGFRAWTVFAADEPPARSFVLDGVSVVIMSQKAKNAGPVVASVGKGRPAGLVKLAEAGHVLPQPRLDDTVASKFTLLEQQATEKVERLEKRVDEISDQLKSQSSQQDQRMTQVQNEVTQLHQTVGTLSSSIETNMSAMFEKLLNQQQTAMTQLRRTTETHIQGLRTECMPGYTELREILSQSPKRHKGVDSQP